MPLISAFRRLHNKTLSPNTSSAIISDIILQIYKGSILKMRNDIVEKW